MQGAGCSEPVTFGGGRMIEKGMPVGSAAGVNSPCCSQRRYQPLSVCRWS